MKVLHITTNYPSPERPAFGAFVRTQVESLRTEGVTCTVFDVDGRGSVLRYMGAWLRLLWHLLTHRYDVLHAHHALSGILLCLTSAPLWDSVLCRMGVPHPGRCVLSYQNSPSHEWGAFTFRLLYPFFRRIVFKAAEKDYKAYAKVRLLPNGCSATTFRPMEKAACKRELGLDPDARYLLFIDANPRRSARGYSQKREDRFDDVVALLQGRLGDTVRPLKLGSEAPERMPLWYNASEMYLLTSDFEGSPNAVKECLMCEVPVVGTPVGDLPFLGQHCPRCHVCKGFDAQELADRAEAVLRGDFSGEAAIRGGPEDDARGDGTVAQGDAVSAREALLRLGYGLEDTARKLLNLYREIV